MKKACCLLSLSLLALAPLASVAMAQTAEIPRTTVPLSWDSGNHNGRGQGGPTLAADDILSVAGVPWIQLQFQNGNLGRNSRIEITSLLDGSTQILDRQTFAEWNGKSAYFNGDAVEIRLYVGPNDRGARVKIKEVVVGEWGPPAGKSICGPTDNRVASNEQRVGRIDPIGCTGWVISNGKQLTAGHCLAGSGNTTLSFNVPQSLSDGTVQFPGPEDQYSIVQGSFQFANGGVGNDWGVFAVNNNSVTGDQPIDAQGSFNIRQDLGPNTIRITGFGVDPGVRGSTNQTNRTHTGSNTGSSGTTMRYNADTTGGNSGSPVIDEATGEAVGIHSHGGCSSGGGNNSGTSFFNSAAWTAIDIGGGGGGPAPNCAADALDLRNFSFTGAASQNQSNSFTVQDSGNEIVLNNNTWVRTTSAFSLSSSTELEFYFKSSSQGEIHAAGFDEDDTLNNNPRYFQFWGTQNWTGTGQINHTPKYSPSDWQKITLDIGGNYTGSKFLAFVNDQDSGSGAQGTFRCVRIIDDGGAPDPNSCVGNCGSQAPGGCWCDSQCTSFGDCCSDKVAVCGP